MSNAFDVIVIGAGPGGYVAAIRAAQLGLKAAVVEREHLGGICLNWGCIPTKALLRSAEIFHLMHRAKDFGLKAEGIGHDLDAVVKRSRGIAKQLNAGVGHLLKKNKVAVVMGEATLPAKGKVSVNASTPVPVGERVFISSGYNHGCALVEFTDEGARSVWENKALRTVLSGAVLYDDHLYGFDESKLKCVALDGKEMWRKRGLGQGALIASDGRLILMSEKGDLIVAQATPEKYVELSKARVMDGGASWTTPTLAGGLIFCRNGQGTLVCRDHRPEEKAR